MSYTFTKTLGFIVHENKRKLKVRLYTKNAIDIFKFVQIIVVKKTFILFVSKQN